MGQHRKQRASGARWLWAALAGVIAAGAVAFGLRSSALPLPALRLVAGDEVRAIDERGGARMVYRVADAGADAESIARTARILEARVEALDGGNVFVAGREITVEAAGVTRGNMDIAARELMRRGELAFHLAREPSPRMKALCRRAERAAGPVGCDIDMWTHDLTGATSRGLYLRAESPAAIERFLAGAAAADPALAPDSENIILLEHIPGDRRSSPPGSWRTYEVERQAALGAEQIADAWVYYDPVTNRPAVVLSFTERGARRFHELTSRNIGRKFAIVLDGRVHSAPVIQDAIGGGRATITLGSGRYREMEEEAQILAAVLRSRAATGDAALLALELIHAQPVAPSIQSWQRTATIGLLALLAGLGAFALVLALEWRAQPLDLAVAGPPDRRPWGRLLLTLTGIAALYLAPRFLPLPGVWLDELTAGMADGSAAADVTSILALGVSPILSAFVIVELAALAVPRWRPLRISGPAGRARLLRAAAVVTVLYALIQSYFISTWLETIPPSYPVHVTLEPGLVSRALITLTLTGGVMVMWIVASLLHRHGLGNGFSLVILAGMLHVPGTLDSGMLELDGAGAPRELAPDLLVALSLVLWLVLMAATSRVLRARTGSSRDADSGPGGFHGLRLPTCGILPVMNVLAVVTGVAAAVGLFEPVPDSGLSRVQEAFGHPAARLLLAAVLAFGYAWLFSRPRPLLAGTRVLDRHGHREQRVAFWRATMLSALYVTGIAAVALIATRAQVPLSLLEPVIMTAIVMDLAAEWRARRRCRDLVSVWPIHRVQLADLAVGALQRAGIDVHTRGRYHRTLFHFFAPFVPIELQVPAERAREAESILRSMLDAGAAAGADAGAGAGRPAAE